VGQTPAGRGERLLEQENLALLVHTRALVLTTAHAVALLHGQLTPVEREGPTSGETQDFWGVHPGPLSDRIAEATRAPDDALVPVRLWQQQPVPPPLPWSDSRAEGLKPIDARGWTAYRLEIPHEGTARLSLVHQDTLRAFSWVAFLAVIGLGWWTAVRRPATLVAALGVFGTVALLLPETYAPIGAGAVLGTLFVVAVWLIRPGGGASAGRPGSGHRAESSSIRKRTPRSPVVLFALSALVLESGLARAGESKRAPRAAPPTRAE
jgi:hypothetical protein